MATEWRYAKSGQQHGPVSAADLKALAKSGEILPTDMIWKEGMDEWKQAGSLKGLFPPTTTPAPQKAPPPLPTASYVTNAPFKNTSEEEKASLLNTIWKYCILHPVKFSGIGFGALSLLILIGGSPQVYDFTDSIGLSGLLNWFLLPMLLINLVLFVLLAFFGVKAFLVVVQYENLVGKWKSHDGLGEPFEIVGKSLTRGSVLVGTIAIQKDKRLEISSGGKVIEAWQLVKLLPKELVFQDAAGEVKRYKKTVTNPLAAFFSTSRAEYLQGSWQPITEDHEWVQFTKDGAVVFSNGSAGRFTLIGEEPNEVIELEMVKGSARQFKIISLTSDQLVIAEGQEATTFRRPKRPSAKTAKGADNRPNDASDATDQQSAPSSKGPMRSIWDFLTKQKCPKCGQYSVLQSTPKRVGDLGQRVESFYENGRYVQKFVNCYMLERSYECESCKHEWTSTYRSSFMA